MSDRGWILLGGLIGASVVTGIGVYAKVQELQSPAFQATAQQRAEAAALGYLNTNLGLTPARLQQFTTIAHRLGAS